MPNSLYLDTARLGRMSPSAHETHLDFVRLAAEEPSSLYFEDFLQHGSTTWPDSYQRRFPALIRWPGIGGLKRQLAQVAGCRASNRVLIASRSLQLMALAARLLSKTCRNVLTTDFSWPAYQNVLQHEMERSGSRVHVARLRRPVLRDRISAEQCVESLVDAYLKHGCDGLFLPAVDNLGTRLPVNSIVRAIRRKAELRFVVVDAAQAFAEVPLDDCLSVADFTIAGCHKWLRGYFPLGIALYGQPGTCKLIHRTTSRMLESGDLDDGLLRFCEQLADARRDGHSETVNLGPLFSCCGAVADALETSASLNKVLLEQAANARLITESAEATNWRPVIPAKAFRTGILLLQQAANQRISGDDVRRLFLDKDVIVTSYDGGMVRLSMPTHTLSSAQCERLRQTLGAATAGTFAVKRDIAAAM